LRKEQKASNLKASVCSKHWLFVVLFLVNSIAVANFSTDNEIQVKGAEGSENELQQLSDALSKEERLAENTDVNLYDGSQTPDDTPVESANDFNKEIAKAGYHANGEQGGNDVYLNIDKTDMTDSSDVVKSLGTNKNAIAKLKTTQV
jgi:hypothetical protein